MLPEHEHNPTLTTKNCYYLGGTMKIQMGMEGAAIKVKKKTLKSEEFLIFLSLIFPCPSQLCLLHFALCLGANTTFAHALPQFEQPWLTLV